MASSRAKVVIVDYGLGNLFSIRRAMEYLGGEAVISGSPVEIARSSRLILPGVGAFGEGMNNLRERGLIEVIKAYASSGRPVMGICLGMQLFMDSSEELGLNEGVGIIKGKVRRLSVDESLGKVKIPHIGWNSIAPRNGASWKGTILEPQRPGAFMYFVHSYAPVCDEPADILAQTEYGGMKFCSAAKRGNIYGFQFHPEKSGEAGLSILSEFMKIC